MQIKMKTNMSFIKTLFFAASFLIAAVPSFSQDKKEVKKVKEVKTVKEAKDVKEVKEVKEVKAPKEVEIVKEVDAVKGCTIHINTTGRNLDIRTGNDNKVKVVTKVFVQEGETATSDELFDKSGMTLKSLNNRVDLTAKQSSNTWYTRGDEFRMENDWNKLALTLPLENKDLAIVQDGEILKARERALKTQKLSRAQADKLRKAETKIYRMDSSLARLHTLTPAIAGTEGLTFATTDDGGGFSYSYGFNTGSHKTLTIYVPAGSKLDIDDKNGNITLTEDYPQATIKISNASLDARKIGNLTLTAKYANVNIGDIDDAEIEFEQGTFTAGNIKNLDMDSKSSTIEYESGNNLTLRSQNDNYTIESLQTLDGRKTYGDLRITKLYKSIDIEGANADIRIRHLMPEAQKVKINDKYADIRLPVRDLKNYTVSFKGNYSTVFAPFEKIAAKDDSEKKDDTKKTTDKKKVEKDQVTTGYFLRNDRLYTFGGDNGAENSPSSFTAKVGDTNGAHTQFDLTCQQCNVDFK
jgi:hypothetical protein